jgi:hypothetical protein
MVTGQKPCCNHGRKQEIDEIAGSVVGAGHVRHGQPTGNGVVADEQLLGADEAAGSLCGYVVERAEEGVAKGNGDEPTADVELELGLRYATGRKWGLFCRFWRWVGDEVGGEG